MNDKELSDLSNMFDPVIRGWANYYGRFHSKALAIVEARERLLGALDATETQTPGSRCDAGCACVEPSRGRCATVIRALGHGILPGGSVMGAG
jgi:RNA-directed DNA polymerase